MVFSDGFLFAGTTAGVYYTDPATQGGGSWTWDPIGGLPNVNVDGITVGTSGDLFVATYGRGVWHGVVTGSAPVTITTSTLPDASYAQPYNASVAASGGFGADSWQFGVGIRPNNLQIQSNGNNVAKLTGALNPAGTYTLTVEATDAWGYTASATLTLNVLQLTLSNATPNWSSDWSPTGTAITLQATLNPTVTETNGQVSFTACPPPSEEGQLPNYGCRVTRTNRNGKHAGQ